MSAPIQKRTAGFSLIEAMITLTIASLLLVSGAPFTQRWVASARVHNAQTLLEQGVARAKAVALRNPGGMQANEAATVLCLRDNRLLLFAATRSPQTSARCATSNALWSADLPTSTTVMDSTDNAMDCLAFNNRGASTASGSVADDCSSSTSLQISSSGEHVSVTLH